VSEGRDEVDDVDADEVPHRNETGEQDGGDQDDHGGIDELLVLFETLDFRIGLQGQLAFRSSPFTSPTKRETKAPFRTATTAVTARIV
jgi:hypothetical protein